MRWGTSIVLFAAVCITTSKAYRKQTGDIADSLANQSYFLPYEKGFVGVYGEPRNFKRERINEGAFESSNKELIFDNSTASQVCPGMVGPFSDGSYYCTAREYGYCDRRFGMCFCNTGYQGIDCSDCTPEYYKSGGQCFPKKLCPNDCSGAGTCRYEDGVCECFPHRVGVDCGELLCKVHHPLCEACTADDCLRCKAGYYITDSGECSTCFDYDPRCSGCTKDDGCTFCADPLLTSVRRSGYRSSDPALPVVEESSELSITLPFGTKDPDAFADAEAFIVVSTPDKPLKDSSTVCHQGVSQDESWDCYPKLASHRVCGHKGVFMLKYPNFVVSETAKFINMSVSRSGGGYGDVFISYFILHITTNGSDVTATAPYTTSQTLEFSSGIVERTFLINILDDNLVEEDEVFQVVLEIPEGGGSLGTQFRANVTIIDDDSNNLSPKFTRHIENSTTSVAGEPFSVWIQAVVATGYPVITGGERFLSVVENDNDAWSREDLTGRGQRQAQRTQCTVYDSGNGTYEVRGVIHEQGKFQVRSWHAFPGGLLGEYHSDAFFETLALSRIDRHVNFTWGDGRLLPRGSDYISIRWSGAFLAPENGTYGFQLLTDDNARLWLNGDLLIDHWHIQEALYEPPRYVELEADSLNDIVMEYRDIVGDAFARLMWKPPSEDEFVVIPVDYLFSLHEISVSPFELTVVSAPTDANTTECSGSGLFGAIVHHESDFEICPRDRFGNLRDDGDDIYLASEFFSATMELISGQDEYTGVGSHVLNPTLSYSKETHCFTGRYTPERAGVYSLSILFQEWWDRPHHHVAGSPFTLSVVPNRVDGPNSRVYFLDTPHTIEAGKCHNFTIEAHDTSHNLLLEGGDQFSTYMYRVDFFEDDDEESRSIEAYDGDRNNTVSRKGAIYDLQNGNYTAILCPILTGWYEIHVQVNGDGVSNLPFRVQDRLQSQGDRTGMETHTGQYVHHSPYRLFVHHSDASFTKTTAEGAGLIGATVGVPITFMVTVRDDWGNVVRNIDRSYNLSFWLGKSPGIDFDAYDHNNGSVTVEYTAVKSGNDIVSVFVRGGHIVGSPFAVNIVDGVDDVRYSYAKGPGLIIGTTGVISFFELFAFDLGNNRKSEFSDRYAFNTSGTEVLSGHMVVASDATSENEALPLYQKFGTGGDYIGTFIPSVTGDLKISVFLEVEGETPGNVTLLEVHNSPFIARIHPSFPHAALTDIDGVLYDTFAGTPSRINIHLRDVNNNKLETGGHTLEMVALGVSGDWGTIQPWGTLPGIQDRYYYKGFYSDLDDVYGTWTDHQDGSYTAEYTIYTTGEYVLRLSVAEPGLNATYFNTSTFGYLVDLDSNPADFAASREGIPENLGSTISWTGDIESYSYIHMFRSKVENNIDFDFSDSVAGREIGYDDETYSSFTLDEKARERHYSVRYTGLICPPVAEVFNFTIVVDRFSAVSVRIGGLGGSTNMSEPGDFVAGIELRDDIASTAEATGMYNFTDMLPREFLVEYSHLSGDSYFTLFWESPSTPKTPVPASAFFHWRNMSHYNLTVHPAPLCSDCSTAYGSSLTNAVVGEKQSFVVYGRDFYSNLQQKGGEVVTAVGVGPEGATFRGVVTDYQNSTYLVEYYPTQAGKHLLYVTIGCCPDHPNIGLAGEIKSMKNILVKGAPFSLDVVAAEPDPKRSVVVGPGIVGTTTGKTVSFSVLYRDLHNNPTKAGRATMAQRGNTNSPLVNGGVEVAFYLVVEDANDGTLSKFTAVPDQLEYHPHEDDVVVTYSFSVSGTYEMHISMFSETIFGSPYNMVINHNVASANTTVCRGLGLHNAYTKQSATFEVLLSDRFSNALSIGGNKFYARVVGSGYNLDGTGPRSPLDVIVPSCVDGQSGRYLCTYSARTPGPFEIRIKLLKGSPAHPGGRGLKGYYFSRGDGNWDSPLTAPEIAVDKILSFSWPNGLSVPVNEMPDTLPGGLFSSGLLIRWEGYIVAPLTDDFTIFCESLGFNSSVYIESVLVFDSLLPSGQQSSSISLIADASYRIRIEILTTELVGQKPSGFRLLWKTKDMKKSVIPAFYLYDEADEIAFSPFPVSIVESTSK